MNNISWEDRRKSVLVIIVALNEEAGMGPTLSELKKTLDEPGVLAVDGNSTDRTAEIAKAMGAEVIVQRGTGKGNAVGQAIMNVKDNEYVAFINPDFTYPSGYLPQMIEILGENSKVGMMYRNRSKDELNLRAMHDTLYIGNRLLAFTARALFGECILAVLKEQKPSYTISERACARRPQACE